MFPLEFIVGPWDSILVKVEPKHMLRPISEDRRKQTNKRKVRAKIEREEKKKILYQYISLGL